MGPGSSNAKPPHTCMFWKRNHNFLIYTLFIWSLENFKRNSGYLGLQVTINIGRDKQKLEDLKVLRRSPDLLNNVKIGQGQLQLIMKQILFYHILGLQPFWSSDLNNPMNTPSNSPVISEEKMLS